MPELELDTVWEGGEISTGDEIDRSSSISSMVNGAAMIPNISQQHKLESNAASKTFETKNIDAVIQVEPVSIELNNMASVVHEHINHETTQVKCRLNHTLNNDYSSHHLNTTETKLKEAGSYVAHNTQEIKSQGNRYKQRFCEVYLKQK